MYNIIILSTHAYRYLPCSSALRSEIHPLIQSCSINKALQVGYFLQSETIQINIVKYLDVVTGTTMSKLLLNFCIKAFISCVHQIVSDYQAM